jgi:dihydroflavonol-4-reductase
MVQNGRDTSTINDLPVEKVKADLLDLDSVTRAMTGCEATIHVAAATAIWPPRSRIVRMVNIEGTRNMLEAAKRNRIKRMVHVGTANTFAPGTKERPGDENGPYVFDRYGLDYMDSKYIAHQLVAVASQRGDVPVVEVNPTFMWGPYDRAPGAGKMILRICRGEAPGHSRGGRNCAAVKDVVVAIANALTMGRPGEAYILAGENLTYREIFQKIGDVVNVRVPDRTFPDWMVRLTGIAASTWGVVSRVEPLVSRAMARISCDEHYYSPAKAIRELQLPQSPIEEGIEGAYRWFLANGYVYDDEGKLLRRIPAPRLA